MRSEAHFELELKAANSAAAGEVTHKKNEADVVAFANEHLQPSAELFIACIGDGVDFGNLIIEVNAQRNCNLRILERRGFSVEGVSVKQALCALEYWLPAQERTPSLGWQG